MLLVCQTPPVVHHFHLAVVAAAVPPPPPPGRLALPAVHPHDPAAAHAGPQGGTAPGGQSVRVEEGAAVNSGSRTSSSRSEVLLTATIASIMTIDCRTAQAGQTACKPVSD